MKKEGRLSKNFGLKNHPSHFPVFSFALSIQDLELKEMLALSVADQKKKKKRAQQKLSLAKEPGKGQISKTEKR